MCSTVGDNFQSIKLQCSFPKNGHGQGPCKQGVYQLNTKINASGRAEYAIMHRINVLIYHNEPLPRENQGWVEKVGYGS